LINFKKEQSKMNIEKSFNISIEQSKLLGSALRIKIISVLLDTPQTAKQVAELLGHSPGNVHYHIKKLHDGGLIDLVETKKIGGVTEKYYISKAKWFNSNNGATIDPALKDDFNSTNTTTLGIRLNLTADQLIEMTEGFKTFLEKWVKNSSVEEGDKNVREYSIGVKIVDTEQKDKV
jgi:DNA-binding transcriptional ArsR family regulator